MRSADLRNLLRTPPITHRRQENTPRQTREIEPRVQTHACSTMAGGGRMPGAPKQRQIACVPEEGVGEETQGGRGLQAAAQRAAVNI